MNLNINDHSFLSLVLVPFFNKLNFLSKKELDNKDWKSILDLKTNGWHLSKEGANLILALSKHMNKNRLSSNVLPVVGFKGQTRNLDSTQFTVQSLTVLSSTVPEAVNYNLLVAKVQNLLSKPSNL